MPETEEIDLGRPAFFSLPAAVRFVSRASPLTYDVAGDTLRLACPLDGYASAAGAVVRQAAGTVRAAVTDRRFVPQLRRILSLDDDGSFAALLDRDPVLRRVAGQLPGLRPVLFPSPYEAAVWSILSLRRPQRQAAALKRRLAAELGEEVELGGVTVPAFPLPGRIVELDAFRGLAGERLARLRAVARAALEGRLDATELAELQPDEALAELQEIAGIGPFFASLVLVRGAGARDHLPLEVPRVRQAIARAYGLADPTSEELAALAESWRPYRSWVAFLLRAADDTPAAGATDPARG